jgi:molybdopterin converting factor small subunit
MKINVRLSGDLVQQVGNARLQVTLAENATAADLVAFLQEQYPAAASRLELVVPFVGGQHVSPEAPLVAGQEVALLLPIAGG